MTRPALRVPYRGGVYREHPSRWLEATVWTRRAETETRNYRILPDGCLDLIWSDDGLLVAGPDTGPYVGRSAPGASFVGLRFDPGIGPTVLGVPADALTDRRLPASDLWPTPYVDELTERLAAADRPGRVLESIAIERLTRVGPADPVATAIADDLRAGRSVAETARQTGFSERQLHRRCLAAFGYGPKTLARVLRLGRALTLARSGMPLADVGVNAGYADQAHLSREVRSLTGVSPRTLLAQSPSDGSAAKRSTPLPSGSRMTA
jgi:AraC-like DNA-binding protein